MTGEQALRLFRDRARVAAACGALQVPGDGLIAALDAIRGRVRGELGLASDARLDRLGIVVGVAADAVSDALGAAGLDPDPARALLAELHPAEARLSIEADVVDARTAEVRVAVDLGVGSALEALGRSGAPEEALVATSDALDALGLALVDGLSVHGGGWAVHVRQNLTPAALPARGEALAAACAVVGASRAQGAWQRAMLDALAPGRSAAPVAIGVGEPSLAVTWSDVVPETLLRLALQFHPLERTAAVLGALAGAASADRARVVLVAHRAEPPLVRFSLAP